jgi:hypothetical protein
VESRRSLHLVHLLIRKRFPESVRFLIYPHDKWKDETGQSYLTLPTKKTVADPLAPFLQGSSLEHFLEVLLEHDLALAADDFALEQEIEPAQAELKSPRDGTVTSYTIYPVDVWLEPRRLDELCQRVLGTWVSCQEALATPRLSPTARAVFQSILDREHRLEERYRLCPEEALLADAPRGLLDEVGAHPTMEALARKWLSRSSAGVRHLRKQELDAILAAGKRAFNLRVADPYLRYQLQGVGFSWSFFTHADPQDLHVHGAPIVEIYGVLEGKLEVWWKAYHARGTSAWSHRILETGDWLEVDSLQCHIVHWLGEGKGVVFKAGPGPLAEVGRLGVKGKTPCGQCPCMKPSDVERLDRPPAKS